MNIFTEAARLEAANQPFALTSIIETRGSVPRDSGRMLVREDGSITGSVGGGLLEATVIDQAREALAEGRSRSLRRHLISQKGGHCSVEAGGETIREWDIKEEDLSSSAKEPGGSITVYIDVVLPRPSLVLVGGGHVNLAIAAAAAPLGFALTVVESRPEFCTPKRFPGALKRVLEPDFKKALGALNLNSNTSVVIASIDQDKEALALAAPSPAAYVGMLSSKRKASKILRELQEEGIPLEALNRVRAPMGLDIGAHTPAEIAVSVLAEILSLREGHSSRPLQGMTQNLVVLRGGGDLATGTAWRLRRCGFAVVVLEIPQPTVIRRSAAFAQALYQGSISVEGVTARKAEHLAQAYEILEAGEIPVLADPGAGCLETLHPAVVVDAILAKRNLGTHRGMAPVTIALGPGFTAGKDVDAVVETNRGHSLGRVIEEGSAAADTGIPGTIGGQSVKRVLRAPAAGKWEPLCALGDLVVPGQILGKAGGQPVLAPFKGLVRGLMAGGLRVKKNAKVGDVDPRGGEVDYQQISDKSRAVAGGVLEALLLTRVKKEGINP